MLIDQFSKYPEVDVISSTSFSKLQLWLDRILATHGVPDEITTDNGPPYFSDKMAHYTKKTEFRHRSTTPMDPQSNRFAENFVNHCANWSRQPLLKARTPARRSTPFYYSTTPHPILPQANLCRASVRP